MRVIGVGCGDSCRWYLLNEKEAKVEALNHDVM